MVVSDARGGPIDVPDFTTDVADLLTTNRQRGREEEKRAEVEMEAVRQQRRFLSLVSHELR